MNSKIMSGRHHLILNLKKNLELAAPNQFRGKNLTVWPIIYSQKKPSNYAPLISYIHTYTSICAYKKFVLIQEPTYTISLSAYL